MASKRPENEPLHVPPSFVGRVQDLASEIVRLTPDQLAEIVSSVLADWYMQIQRQNASDKTTRPVNFQNEAERDEWISKRVTNAYYRLHRGDRLAYNARELQQGASIEALGDGSRDVDDLVNTLIFENFARTLTGSERQVLGTLLEIASEEDVSQGKLADKDLAVQSGLSPQRFSEIQKNLIDRLLRELRR